MSSITLPVILFFNSSNINSVPIWKYCNFTCFWFDVVVVSVSKLTNKNKALLLKSTGFFWWGKHADTCHFEGCWLTREQLRVKSKIKFYFEISHFCQNVASIACYFLDHRNLPCWIFRSTEAIPTREKANCASTSLLPWWFSPGYQQTGTGFHYTHYKGDPTINKDYNHHHHNNDSFNHY